MRRAFVIALVVVSGCKEVVQDHCNWRGEHAFCAANFPEAPFCSPCAVVEEQNGCVAREPSEDACPEFERPETSSSSGAATDTDSSTMSAQTGATDASATD